MRPLIRRCKAWHELEDRIVQCTLPPGHEQDDQHLSKCGHRWGLIPGSRYPDRPTIPIIKHGGEPCSQSRQTNDIGATA